MSEYAGLHILKNPYHIDNTYDYFIPPLLREHIKLGDLVTVPFGNSNKREIAVVVSLKDCPDNPNISCKPISTVCDPLLSLSPEMLGLCSFIREQTICTVGEAVKTLLPSSILTKPEEIYTATDLRLPNEYKLFDGPTLYICEYIRKRGSAPTDLLKTKFGPALKPALKALTEKNLIFKDYQIRESGRKTEAYYVLNVSEEQAKAIKDRTDTEFHLRSVAQIGVVTYFLRNSISEIDEKKLMEDASVSYAQLKSLCDKGVLERRLREIDRSKQQITPEIQENVRSIVLNDEQAAAFETLKELSDSNEAKAALLFGVTGSGKTSVMMKTIDHVLEKGKSVIVLLPEISLTPQTLGIFCSRYGERVAIIHSMLSDGERLDAYKRIKRGGADVVIGTRSAVFAPLKNLGMIIIDEEQEHTYKSDRDPKYHARDIARYRCSYNGALMLLASATPSFESFYKAEQGLYTLIKLNSRYGKAKLPKVSVIDMRKTAAEGVNAPIGNTLCEKLVETKMAGNQSILFINRRGYNSFLSCRSCGNALTCPNCSVSMTYHTVGNSYDKGELRCHWCGRRMPVPDKCPQCESEHLARIGYGTQRIERELGDLLPDARILRMDTDTTGTKNSYEELLGTFRAREADVLLGTQMVTKGHDFPDVTLVGVLLADTSLYLDDYRAGERTFAMLTQVIGRAGRADKEGEAIIQTANPDHECIRLACRQDYESFYKNEMRLRKALRFPPFCDIALMTLTSPNEKELIKSAKMLAEKFSSLASEKYSDIPLISYGPFEAPVYKVENKYRMRMVVKCKLNKRSRALFADLLREFTRSVTRTPTLSIDLNPSNL